MAAPQSQKTRWVVFVLVNLVSLGCLVWTLRDANLADLGNDFATMNWWWVALAIAAELGVYLWQAVRWRLVLRPVAPLGFGHAVRAIYVGLFASEALPFRGGEVLRCYLVSRWTKLPFSVTAASVLIERVFDGMWLWLGLLVSLAYVPFQRQLRYVDDGFGIIIATGAVLMALALFRPRRVPLVLPESGWRRRLAVLMDDLAQMGHSRFLLFAFLHSLPYLLVQVIPIWALFRGYGFDLGWDAALALMVLLRLASIVPQAPASLGLFQLLTKQFLERVFNVDSAEAARFSLILWGAMKLPLLLAGFAAVVITETRIGELKKAADAESQSGGAVAPVSSR